MTCILGIQRSTYGAEVIISFPDVVNVEPFRVSLLINGNVNYCHYWQLFRFSRPNKASIQTASEFD